MGKGYAPRKFLVSESECDLVSCCGNQPISRSAAQTSCQIDLKCFQKVSTNFLLTDSSEKCNLIMLKATGFFFLTV